MTTILKIAQRHIHEALARAVREDGPEEYQLHCEIVSMLQNEAVPGLIYWHTPNGLKRDPLECARLKAMGVLAGVVDLILALPNRRVIFMEVKGPDGMVSQAQSKFLDEMKAHGHVTAVVRSIDQARSVLWHWGAIAPHAHAQLRRA